MEFITKVSKKGQVTIPKKIRDLLNSNIIKFVIKNEEVTIEPVKDVGGSLAKFAKKKFYYKEERDIAWENVVKKYK